MPRKQTKKQRKAILAPRKIKRIHLLIIAGLFVVIGIIVLSLSHADYNPYRGNIAVTTYIQGAAGKELRGGVLITPDNVGVNDECPRAPATTDQTKGSNYGQVHYYDCPVAWSSTNNHAKQYDVYATIPSGYIVSADYLRATGAKLVNGNQVVKRVAVSMNSTSNVEFVFWPPVVGNISNTASRNRLGGGAWITNIPSGYYLGKVYDGWRIDVNKQSPSGYLFGRITRNDWTDYGCYWIEPGLVTSPVTISDSTCTGKDLTLQNRDSFGIGYNCGDHICVDGAYTELVAGCDARFYYNYKGGLSVDLAGTQTTGVYYRFTTLDGKAAVVRSKTLGWGFISKSCISGYPQGGTLKL